MKSFHNVARRREGRTTAAFSTPKGKFRLKNIVAGAPLAPHLRLTELPGTGGSCYVTSRFWVIGCLSVAFLFGLKATQRLPFDDERETVPLLGLQDGE
jgi:hypothetical protein